MQKIRLVAYSLNRQNKRALWFECWQLRPHKFSTPYRSATNSICLYVERKFWKWWTRKNRQHWTGPFPEK